MSMVGPISPEDATGALLPAVIGEVSVCIPNSPCRVRLLRDPLADQKATLPRRGFLH
jgi:hypothetical protein